MIDDYLSSSIVVGSPVASNEPTPAAEGLVQQMKDMQRALEAYKDQDTSINSVKVMVSEYMGPNDMIIIMGSKVGERFDEL